MDELQKVDYLFHWDRDTLTILRNWELKDHLTYKILSIFFEPPFPPRKPSFTIQQVTQLLPGEEGKVEEIVQQLEQDGFLIKNPLKPGYYQYNYNSPHVESQVAFEKAYVDEHLPKLPRCETIGGIDIFL